MRTAATLLPCLLLLASMAPAVEVRIRRTVDACPVDSADRWGWRVAVFREAPGQWVVHTQGPDPALPDPEALSPLTGAIRTVRARMVYAAETWTEDPDQALRAGRGNCISFVAVLERELTRLGFRTRRVHGLLFSLDGASNPYYLAPLQATPHRWLEVFTPDHGWVPLDPSAQDGRLTGRHLALKGNDTEGWLHGTSIEVLQWD